MINAIIYVLQKYSIGRNILIIWFWGIASVVFLLQCQCNKKENQLSNLQVSTSSGNRNVKFFDRKNNTVFEVAKYNSDFSYNFFSHVAINPAWKSEGLTSHYPSDFFLLNYFYLFNKNKDSFNLKSVNSFLKKISIGNMIDFRSIEGQALANIIFLFEYGNIENLTQNFKLSTIPKMPFSQDASLSDSIINIETVLSLQKNNYFTSDEFLCLVKDKTLLDQYSNIAKLNGTIMLSVLTLPKARGKSEYMSNNISFYYQYIESDILQIGKIDLNPYRVFIID